MASSRFTVFMFTGYRATIQANRFEQLRIIKFTILLDEQADLDMSFGDFMHYMTLSQSELSILEVLCL
jgi:hypothetical protein